ncbi:MAG: folate-binding protein [Betaproteobacteria bacterium]|nr:folate-binding protein [Betaproteobacteria bacterium]
MDADLISRGAAVFARLPQYATLAVTGADARAFLHAQLSNDIEHLAGDTARRAGYCSPKGRLLASFLVIPCADGFLLQVSRDIAATIAKRLSMYVLRSKVKLVDVSEARTQFGVWGRDSATLLASCGVAVPVGPLQVTESPGSSVVCIAIAEERNLVLAAAQFADSLGGRFAHVAAHWWTLAEVRDGLPTISLPTQDRFVPQMANFELIGGIDFKKGCYPGQEIVARSQYLGKLKRRMYRGETDAPDTCAPMPGQDLFGSEPQAVGEIVNVAPRPHGGYEFLAVMQMASVDGGGPLRIGASDGAAVRIASLPYAV